MYKISPCFTLSLLRYGRMTAAQNEQCHESEETHHWRYPFLLKYFEVRNRWAGEATQIVRLKSDSRRTPQSASDFLKNRGSITPYDVS
jgi:hypothetical protein